MENYYRINNQLVSFLKKISRVLRNNFQKFIYSTLLLLYIYQFYDITHQYFRYEHSIHLVISKIPSVIPSITHCVYQKNLINDDEDGSFHCRLLLLYKNTSQLLISCKDISKIMYVRYRNNSICVTFKNNIVERDIEKNMELIETYKFVTGVFGYKRSQLTVHDHFTPPHFETKNVFQMSNNYVLRLSIKKINILYLQHPYSTDCRQYSYEEGSRKQTK